MVALCDEISFIRYSNPVLYQVRGFASIGMVECWNIGKMGLDLRPAEPKARRGYCNIP
jgi:hypothetical protein